MNQDVSVQFICPNEQAKSKMSKAKVVLVICSTILLVHSGLSKPNQLRGSNSSENLQNAPYLLEAVETISADKLNADKNSPSSDTSRLESIPMVGSSLVEEANGDEEHAFPAGTEVEQNQPGDKSSIAEDNTNLMLESQQSIKFALNTSVPHVPEKISSADLALENISASQQDSVELDKPKGQLFKPNVDRKPQLPVTSSHLKRPVLPVQDDRDDSQTTLQKVAGGGAKSFVSPSVESDEPPPSEARFKRKPVHIPDVLEPSQIMHIQNSSSIASIPAIISREYGHQTRTRITLGGGYVRERPSPAPGRPLRGIDQPDKIVVIEEKPIPSKIELILPDAPRLEVGSSNKIVDKIVTLAEILESSDAVRNVSLSASSTTTKPAGKKDPRCPADRIKTIEHPTACDKFFYCEDGYIQEMVCPNGLMYGLRDMEVDYCVHRWKADCQDKTLPNPISSPGCRWQYGIFNVQGSPKCSPDFYECRAGKFEVKKCHIEGQVYDDRTKSCMFAEQVGCLDELLADFSCPVDDQSNTYWPFPRYFLNERALIHCINDKPQIVRCTEHERVDPEHLHCVPLASLPQLSSTGIEKRRKKSN